MEATETGEIEAFRDLYDACPKDVAAEQGVASVAIGSAFAYRVDALPGAVEVNHALGVSSPDQLDPIAEFYAETSHSVSPLPGVDLDGELRERGYEPGYAWMKFRRNAEPAPPAETDLRVVAVEPDAGADFARAFCGGYGLPQFLVPWLTRLPGRPGWHCLVAYDGDEPGAAGALYVHEQVGWLGMAATLPSHRRRGAQNAILAARIARAVEAGCTAIVTETGERVEGRPSNSYRNILRAGFAEAYLRPNYRSNRVDG